jgi:hypothetical protein
MMLFIYKSFLYYEVIVQPAEVSLIESETVSQPSQPPHFGPDVSAAYADRIENRDTAKATATDRRFLTVEASSMS